MKSLNNLDGSVDALKVVLADTYILKIKIQNVHWNAEGEGFIAIHKHLDEQYESLSDAIDEIAERIRALGEDAPASMQTFLSLSRIDDREEASKDIKRGIKMLADDHENIASLITEHIAVLEKDNDYGTVDLLTDRIREHDKFAWLLRANL